MLKSGQDLLCSSTDKNTQSIIYAIIHTYVEQAVHSALVYAALTDSCVTPSIIKQALIYESLATEGAGKPCERAMKRVLSAGQDGMGNGQEDVSLATESDAYIESRLSEHLTFYTALLHQNESPSRQEIITTIVEKSLSRASENRETPQETGHVNNGNKTDALQIEIATEDFLKEWNSIANNNGQPESQVGQMVLSALHTQTN